VLPSSADLDGQSLLCSSPARSPEPVQDRGETPAPPCPSLQTTELPSPPAQSCSPRAGWPSCRSSALRRRPGEGKGRKGREGMGWLPREPRSSSVTLRGAGQAEVERLRLLGPSRAGTPAPLGLPELRGRGQELAAPPPRPSVSWQSSGVCRSSATPGPRGGSRSGTAASHQPVLHFSLALRPAARCRLLSFRPAVAPVLFRGARPWVTQPCPAAVGAAPRPPREHQGRAVSPLMLQIQPPKPKSFFFALQSTAPDKPLPLGPRRRGELPPPQARGSPQPLCPCPSSVSPRRVPGNLSPVFSLQSEEPGRKLPAGRSAPGPAAPPQASPGLRSFALP